MNPLRKIIQRLGIDVHKHRTTTSQLTWLRDLNIQTVFDIGANVGQFATEIRAELPDAQIYSFEPLSECYTKLTQTFKRDSHFKAFNCALGETTSSMTMNKSSYTPSSSLRPMATSHKELFPHTAQSKPETISIKRLDDMWSELNPQKNILIKVDTQGYEDKVIAGGMNAFASASTAIIEASFVQLYEGQPLFNDIYQKMISFGFKYQGSLHQKLNKKTGEVLFEDAIFIK